MIAPLTPYLTRAVLGYQAGLRQQQTGRAATLAEAEG